MFDLLAQAQTTLSVSNAPHPRMDQLPNGASRNTWPAIVNNKVNMEYCCTHFDYLGNRIRCIQALTTETLP
eukprot:CAMPEP_0114563416 /NCGR_PEP_ID=MMETSP0114-20121206/13094_1 /TAXON_ID=31324 /ORGANISM="Goniomonas sp, Strain m" /LENGTH=70 /DNA_ID=CAMNT_0001749253 /DNA_START=12 /DNA_END=224 /DNA_ORIENTATION=+